MRCDPANSIVSKLGGLTAVSKMTGVPVHTVSRWRRPRDKGGTGGIIPHWHHAKILAGARAASIDLDAADFLQAFDDLPPAPSAMASGAAA